MCHLILLSPLLALPLFFILPFKTALITYLLVVSVSVFIYFKIAMAIRSRVRTGKEAMTGAEALVVQDISPEGKIQFGAELWTAMSGGEKFSAGEVVTIQGFRGLRVVVGSQHCQTFSSCH
jgi:membrane-bound ClpP family serine protease